MSESLVGNERLSWCGGKSSPWVDMLRWCGGNSSPRVDIYGSLLSVGNLGALGDRSSSGSPWVSTVRAMGDGSG